MKTIDKIISELVDKGLSNLHPSVPLRDVKILKNISNIMSNSFYITEAQGNLLIKILKENLEYLDTNELDIANNLKFPTWEKSFRQIEKIRKVDIEEKEKGKFFIKIEFNSVKEVRKTITLLNKKLEGDVFFGNPKLHYYHLFEKNLTVIHDTLEPLKFTFSPEFLELYEKVKAIDSEYVFNKFKFENFYKEKNQYIKKYEMLDSDLIILDRKLRYQYTYDQKFDENTQDSLEYKIANRIVSKIFVHDLHYTFNQLVDAIINLRRDKILFVFDNYDISNSLYRLKLINNYLLNNNLKNLTGIYFRFDNKGPGEEFNKIISENKLNKRLDDTTKFVGIDNGKIPKFMLKSDWYPDAVISFTNNLRSNKSEVYCNDCDLVVYYTSTKPLMIKSNEIL
jgi:hypothetical protein